MDSVLRAPILKYSMRWFARSETAICPTRGSQVIAWQVWNFPCVLPVPPYVFPVHLPSRVNGYTQLLP